MRRQNIVERIENVGDAQVLGVVDGDGKVAPEIAQDLFPIDFAR